MGIRVDSKQELIDSIYAYGRKLQLNKHDDAVYSKLLSFEHPVEKDFNETEQCTRICQNYFNFVNKLKELTTEEIEAIWDAFDRLNIINLEIGEENPQEILRVSTQPDSISGMSICFVITS